MAVSLNDQFYLLDPASPPPDGSTLEVQDFTLVDSNEDGIIRPIPGIRSMDWRSHACGWVTP